MAVSLPVQFGGGTGLSPGMQLAVVHSPPWLQSAALEQGSQLFAVVTQGGGGSQALAPEAMSTARRPKKQARLQSVRGRFGSLTAVNSVVWDALPRTFPEST